MIDTVYRLYLPNSRDWIMETSDDRVWLKTKYPRESFEVYNIDDAIRTAKLIATQKNLVYGESIQVISETYEIKRSVVE